MSKKHRKAYFTIAVVGLKGGIGKSLIATLLACGFHRAKRKTLLVDGDDQGSARTWKAKAIENNFDVPLVFPMDSRNILHDLDDAADGYEAVIVDTPARLQKEARASMMVADLVLLPAVRGGAGMWALEQSLEVVEEARAARTESLPAYIVPNRIEHTTLSQIALERMAELPLPCIVGLGNRIAFDEGFTVGSDVCEVAPNSEAANEARALFRAVSKLEKRP
jgi:chromosome partitioning protein